MVQCSKPPAQPLVVVVADVDVSEVEVVVAEDSDVEAEEEDSEVDEEDSEEEVGVATPIGPVSVVIVAADEVASAKLSSQRKKKRE